MISYHLYYLLSLSFSIHFLDSSALKTLLVVNKVIKKIIIDDKMGSFEKADSILTVPSLCSIILSLEYEQL